MLTVLLLAFFVSAAATLWVIRSAHRNGHHTGDHDLSGPQKLHVAVVPRVGGLGIFIGFSVACGLLAWTLPAEATLILGLWVCSLPAFGVGLMEDLTKRASPRRRLVFTALAGLLAAWLLGGVIARTDIPGVEWIAATSVGAVFLAVFVVAGVANSINIIDGMNGLASMCSILMMAALVYVAIIVGDWFIAGLGLAVIGAVLGFFMWNYPRGLVFLGDGGAYFLGFMLAELGILLIVRHPDVSPIFPLLTCAYPVFETLFSMYRRKFVRGRPVSMPDGIHLHTLVYRRLMRWALGSRDSKQVARRNSMTSPYLWVLCTLTVVPAMLWWDSTPMLYGALGAFIVAYIYLYRSIVRFATPRVLVRFSRTQPGAADEVAHAQR